MKMQISGLTIAIHPDGWPFIGGFAAVALVLTAIDGTLGWVG
jgi:hypothetical protein